MTTMNDMELELVNGGDNYPVIDLSNHENRIVLGPVSTRSNRVTDRRVSQLEHHNSTNYDW